MKKIVLAASLTAGLTANVFAFNMAYVEVNTNRFDNVGCYVEVSNQKPIFQVASIFAANINGESPNAPEIYLNPEVSATLNSEQVNILHKKGIKVLVTLLGNHQNAGWACMTDPVAAGRFANDVVAFINKYNLDGIDIDDEYSRCNTNEYSMIMMAQAIKAHPGFKGKLLTKALFADYSYFRANYRGHTLSEYLDYGWEMSYSGGDFMGRLRSYIQAGMPVKNLMVGAWVGRRYPDPYEYGKFSANNGVAGMMAYDVTKESQSYLDEMQRGSGGSGVGVLPGCLR